MKNFLLVAMLVLAALAAGYSFGSSRASIHGKDKVDIPDKPAISLPSIVEHELDAQEEVVARVYLTGSTDAAKWALEALLKSYDRSEKVLSEVSTNSSIDLRFNKAMTHMRLYKLYSNSNDAQKKEEHLAAALALTGDTTAEPLLGNLDVVDKMAKDAISSP